MTIAFEETGSNRSQPFFLGLVGRVLPPVLLILILSLGLSAVLSILSFERVYLKNLTDNFEIAGTDAARKVERALKFGKRIDGFVGMERIIRPMFKELPHLDEVIISDTVGKVFFWYRSAARPTMGHRLSISPPGGRILQTHRSLIGMAPARNDWRSVNNMRSWYPCNRGWTKKRLCSACSLTGR
jgi:hypothetical protein